MKISVITVCLNSEDTIKETLYSVASQSYPDIEHIVVDGVSTDSTMDIINSFKRNSLKVISGNDSGLYDAMNKGIEMATGDYLFFLNSDDKFLHKYAVEIFAREGLAEGYDLVYGTHFWMDKNTGKYGLKQQRNINKFDLWQVCPTQPTLFYKKDLFSKFGTFNKKYKICADYDWTSRVLSKEKLSLKFVDTPINLFDTNGVSQGRTPIHSKERKEIDTKYFSKLELLIFNLINTSTRRKIARTKLFGKIFKLKSTIH